MSNPAFPSSPSSSASSASPSSPSSGLTRGRLLRLRLRAWNPATLGWWLLVLALAELRGGLLSAQDHSWVPAAIAPAILVGALILGALITLIPRRRNASLLDGVSPEAVQTMRDGLAAAGRRVPDRFAIGTRGTTAVRFHGWSGRRATLYLALPQLLALAASDLPVLAASAMAVGEVTAYPTPAQRLWHTRGVLEARYRALEIRGKQAGRRGRRISAFLAATESFAHDVQLRQDQAAVAAAGSADSAARILYSERTINIDVYTYTVRFRRLIARKKRVPASLYAGWFAEWAAAPQWVQDGTLCPVDSFREDHPGLGDFATDGLAEHINALRTGLAGLPATSIVSPQMSKRLAVAAGKPFAGSNTIRAVDGEKIDLDFVYTATPEDTEILAAASKVLGRPATRVDVVEMARTDRVRELGAAFFEPGAVDTEDGDGGFNRGRLLAALLVSALLERGMLRLDPYREWHFTGPDGETIDVAPIVDEATPPHDRSDELLALLQS